MWGPASHCHHQGVPNPTPLSPRRPIVPLWVSHCPHGVPLSPYGCPIVPMAPHCPPMGAPMAPHHPHHVPPCPPPSHQPVLCGAQRLHLGGAGGGDAAAAGSESAPCAADAHRHPGLGRLPAPGRLRHERAVAAHHEAGQPVCVSVRLSVCPCVCVSICVSIHLCVCLSIHLCVHPSVHPSLAASS